MRYSNRPRFANAFPREAALDALVDAFARGDYRRVRAGAKELITSAPEGEVLRAARTLLDRTRPDPLAIWLLVVSGALLLTLSSYWIVNGRAVANDVQHGPRAEPER